MTLRTILLVASFVAGAGAWLLLARALGKASLSELEEGDARRAEEE